MAMVTITRRVEDLERECAAAGIDTTGFKHRIQYMDALRAKLGAPDLDLEIDPMKAADLKKDIDWQAKGDAKFVKISQRYFNDDWVMEPKLDGCRLRMFFGATGNSVITGRRSVRTYAYTQRTENFPHLAGAAIPELTGVILDGEILAPSGKIQSHTGVWTDSLLNASVALCNANPAGSVATQRRFGFADFFAFDILAAPAGVLTEVAMENHPLAADGVPVPTDPTEVVALTGVPYDQRRAVLEHVVGMVQAQYPDSHLYMVPQLKSCGESIEHSLLAGYEGVMIKKRTGVYEAGKRSKVWLKVKTFSTADGFVCGWEPGEHANEGLVGSLNLAVLVRRMDPEEALTAQSAGSLKRSEDPGEAVNYFTIPVNGQPWVARAVAQVGNLKHEWRQEITAEDGSLKQEWYSKVIEWSAQGLGKNGRARHAHMNLLRPDKSPLDCMVDQLDIFPAV